MGFLSIIPVMLLTALLLFENIVYNRAWKNVLIAGLCWILLLVGLYDWRLQFSGIILTFLFTIGIFSISAILSNIIKRKSFWIFPILFFFWITLWLIPHIFGIYVYKLSYTRTITLPIIVGDYSLTNVFGLTTEDYTLGILYLFVISISFSSLLIRRSCHFNKFVSICSLILFFSSFITWDYSPLKFVHYKLTTISLLNFDLGVLFRTHKLFVGITLPLTISLFGLSLYDFFVSPKKQKWISRFLIIFLIILITFKIIIINNKENQVTIIPSEYFNVASWLKEREGLFRVLWLPRTGKYRPGEATEWLKTEGWGAPETSLGIRTYYYYGKPMEYLYPFLMRLLWANRTKSVAYILSYIGVKYLIIHNDYCPWKRKFLGTEKILNNLNNSPYFKLQIRKNDIYIYENTIAHQAIHIGEIPIIINGGLRALTSFIESSNVLSTKFSIFFSDLPIPKDVIYSAQLFVTSNISDLKHNLLINLLFSNRDEKCILVPTRFVKGIEKGKWHPYYIDNPHHAEWEIFYVWRYLNCSFEHSFRFDWGFIGAQVSGESLEIPVDIKKGGSYVIMVRYLESKYGGRIKIRLNNKYFIISTIGDKNGFKWFVINFMLNTGKYVMRIENVDGTNAINIIVILPLEKYLNLLNIIEKIIQGRVVLLDEKSCVSIPGIDITANHSDVIIKSIVYEDNSYVLNIVTVIENVSLGITIPEQYHGAWIALVDGSYRFSSLPPLFVNNFWVRIREPGLHELRIVFFPQNIWRIIYFMNAIVILLILFFVIFYLVCDKIKMAILTIVR